MQLYANPDRPDHAENNAVFQRVVKDFPDLQFFRPSPDKAPWHVQCVIDGPSPQVINFWPHMLKGQRDGFRAVTGEPAIRAIIQVAIKAAKAEPFDVIER